jgi:hypothetical protein
LKKVFIREFRQSARTSVTSVTLDPIIQKSGVRNQNLGVRRWESLVPIIGWCQSSTVTLVPFNGPAGEKRLDSSDAAAWVLGQVMLPDAKHMPASQPQFAVY